MAKIDKEAALQMMQSGETDSEIAGRFGTSRQAVNLLRQSFVRTDKLGGRTVAGEQQSGDQGPDKPESSPSATPLQVTGLEPDRTRPTHPTFDQITDWMIGIIKEAGEARSLGKEHEADRAKIEMLQAEVHKLNGQLRQMSEKLAAASVKSREYEEAVKRAEIRSIPLDMPNPSTWQSTG